MYAEIDGAFHVCFLSSQWLFVSGLISQIVRSVDRQMPKGEPSYSLSEALIDRVKDMYMEGTDYTSNIPSHGTKVKSR